MFFRVRVIGRENIPADGGVLLCSNHINNLDPPFLGAFLKRDTRYMAKSELFTKPVLKGLLPKLGAFPIRRGMSDRQALRTGLGLLKEEEMIGVFPEGTRSRTGELGKGLAGIGFFALRSRAEVVPAAITGSYKPFSRLTIVYGKPVNMEKLREEKVSAEEATEAIMEEIRGLLNRKPGKQ
ncbi:1-acyl-sn-glycerol-3-phosphate acyltransferase [Alteribacter lacisalsi]|uniref:1-acyl-sn-glycerol-3-phosphate acyltransferase n=1 Tax=Alteribacter lacisalsi TaxID=2045244 RepID=A0A2W0HNL3_9BACI|nr:lysophospholipid acyltransferase family protein [Alteribacter lacisalsi]PYZ99185.1 1-acyl-sn-glycerol-3-phosphate acyltransferase [Alteribacter lacisalsi]